MEPDDEQRREELARFLKSRRERLSPADVGLPGTRRRRTSGLRREEVAVLAGLSPTWYTYLEQARDIKPSAQVLDSLSRALQLNADERRYMYVLAFGPTEPVDSETTDEPAIHQALWQIAAACDPNPVYIADQLADVVAWNRAATEWFTDFGELPDEHRNTVWWALMEPEARERLLYWEDEARDMVGRLRAVSGRHLGNKRLTTLVEELTDVSPEMRQWWDNHEISNQAPRCRWLRHPRLGIRAMNLVVAYPNGSNGIGIAFHLPVEGARSDFPQRSCADLEPM